MQKEALRKSVTKGAVDLAKIAIYVENTFDIANPTQQQLQAMKDAAADLGNAGFGTVILAFLHVHSDGTFYYNGTPMSETLSFLPEMVAAIKAPGIVSRVLFSIGPQEGDYKDIQTNYQAFQRSLSTLAQQIRLDGVDFDMEVNLTTYKQLLVELVRWATNSGMVVTAAPYYDEDFWFDVLRRTSSPSSKTTRFLWWNLQIYGGADYSTWEKDLSKTGILAEPGIFLVPGYNVLGGTPNDLQNTLQQLVASYPLLNGSFVWNYELIKQNGYTASQYASAIRTGLEEQ